MRAAMGVDDTEKAAAPEEGAAAEDKAKETAASGTEKDAAKSEKAAKVEPEEVLPVGSAVCFLVSPNTGWVHLVHPDGTRISRSDGSALYFQWEALAQDSEPPGWLAPGTALRVRVDEAAADWQTLGIVQRKRLWGRVISPPFKECLPHEAKSGANLTGSTIRVADRTDMLSARAPPDAALAKQPYETHLGTTESWLQYVSTETGASAAFVSRTAFARNAEPCKLC